MNEQGGPQVEQHQGAACHECGAGNTSLLDPAAFNAGVRLAAIARQLVYGGTTAGQVAAAESFCRRFDASGFTAAVPRGEG